MVWRLLKTSWARRGSLPTDERALAMVAGVDPQTWVTLASRVLWALGYDGNSCRFVVKAIEAALQSLTATSAAKARAGKAGAERRWSADKDKSSLVDNSTTTPDRTFRGMADDSSCHARAIHVPSSAIPEAPEAFFGSPARAKSAALERSDLNTNTKRSSAQTFDNHDVVGRLHAGIDAKAAAALRPWQITEARRLLMAAAERWQTQGKLYRRAAQRGPDGKVIGYRDVVTDSIDVAFIVRTASHARVTPMLMEIAIRRADQESIEKPLGYIRNALGTFDGGEALTPYVSEVDLIRKWERIERDIVDAERAKAATTDLLARIGSNGVQPMNETELAARRGAVTAQLKGARTGAHGA